MTGGVFFHGHNTGPVTCVAVKDLRPSLFGMATGFGEIGIGYGHLCLPFYEIQLPSLFVFSRPVDFFFDSEFFFFDWMSHFILYSPNLFESKTLM